MIPRFRTRSLAALVLPLALVGCSTATAPVTTGGATNVASGGPSAAGGTASVTSSPTPTYPFTPAATPTIMPAGSDAKPSKGGPTLAPTAGGPLNGKIIVVDPGHNGGWAPEIHNDKVDSPFGPFQCMATGTETKGVTPSVTEHALNWAVANKTADQLRAAGATVVMTRPSDTGAGPCNINRAYIANAAKADFLISIHTDGRAPNSVSQDPTGFHVQLEQKMAGGKDVYNRSLAAAENIVREMTTVGKQPLTNYVPRKPAGIWQRSGELTVLAGLKTTPGALVEMGNLRNAGDLARITNPANQDLMATAFVAAIEDTLLKPEYMTPAPSASASASVTTSATVTVSGTPTASPVVSPAPSPTLPSPASTHSA